MRPARLGRRARLGAVVLLLASLPAQARAQRRATVFLDFGGGVLAPGEGPGASSCVTDPFVYPIFLGSERASELAVAEARRLLAPYGVRVVAEPPPAWLPVTHVRIGGSPQLLGLDPALNGLACDVDCSDLRPEETVFMLADKWLSQVSVPPTSEEQLAVQIGRIAVHEAAHSWGLEHTGASESVMARFPSAVEPRFVEGCQPLDLDGDPECAPAHAPYCPAGEQDAHAELLALFGDGSPDTRAPTAAIVWPPPDHRMPVGELVVQVEVGDDHEGFGWMLEVPELQWQHVPEEVTDTELRLVMPPGEYTLHLQVLDHDRNLSEASVVVEVAAPAEEEEPLPGPQAQCACRTPENGGDGRGGGALALLVLLGCARGRRRATLRG